MAKRRNGRYWSKNEKKVMRKLGLSPVPLSGAGEVYKEDGENDYILCQLKSTEGDSATFKLLDVEKLIYHADVVNKIPVFVIEFIGGPMMIATVPEELGNISKYLNEGLFEKKQVEVFEIPKQKKVKKIKANTKTADEIRAEIFEAIWEDSEGEEDEPDDFMSKAIISRKEREKGNKWKKRK